MDQKLSLAAKLEKISREATNCKVLKSLSYGDCEVWNIATCLIQNAETEGNDLISHVESWLCYETKEVQVYFRKLGFTF